MNKEFIPYEEALALKELGFDERCFGFYNPRHEISKEVLYEHTGGSFDNYNRTDYLVSAPLYQQAFRWFREKYGLIGWVQGKRFFMYCIENDVQTDGQLNLSPFKTYEEAELACLRKLIEIVKNK